MIKKITELSEVFDFVWELSQNDLYAGYPRKKPKHEIKASIEKAIKADSQDIIAYYNQNVLCGVCMYLWISEDKYAQTTQILIRGAYDQIADDIIGYLSKQFSGYDLFIPIPSTNKNAQKYFSKRNIECIEAHTYTGLNDLGAHTKQEHNYLITEVTKDNYEEYSIFHDKYAIPAEMSYNSKNLLKDIERFRILTFRKDNVIRGSIFAKVIGEIAEIFGLFLDEEYKNNGIERALIDEIIIRLYDEFKTIKELIFFVDEGDEYELDIAQSAGFEIKGRPRTYKCIL